MKNGLQNGNIEKSDLSEAKKNPFFTTLIVDADDSFSSILEEFLKIEKHFIVRAKTSQEALTLTRHYQPDLILLDSEPKGISGLALLGELLLEQTSAALIMLARTENSAEAVEAMKRGAVDYLTLPLDFQKLKQAIEIQKALFKK